VGAQGRAGSAAAGELSHARAHPNKCVTPGCPASFPRSKFAAIKANEDGWFCGRHDSDNPGWHCPEHVPAWVPAWRARQKALQHKVVGYFGAVNAVLSCDGCKESGEAVPGQAGEDAWPEAVKELRAQAFEHARRTGHQAHVTEVCKLTVTPDD